MKQILIIEDDLAIQKGIETILKTESYGILKASDGIEGFKLAQHADVELIILDIMLPNKNGLDICRDLRNEGITTPILMLTSRSEEIDKVVGLEVGADDYMTKPFSINELKARIRALIRRVEVFSTLKESKLSSDTPKEEVRIFMFLDLKSSTTIAEHLGHIKYYNFLNDFFYDITLPISNCKGEIYQYVGDEIIVSWSLPNGIEQDNCIRCFFDISDVIKNQSDKYLNQYGLIPEFKAGYHYGNVTRGLVGINKKEFVYTGDVLNTTSRIQELCNNYKEKIIISNKLLKLLSLGNQYDCKKIGEVTLKGKKEKEVLFSIRICSGN
jgi:CheY-like chemotaxis protein